MAESLGDRQFESARRVRPGRLVPNRRSASHVLHSEEYATAVVDADGKPLALAIENLLEAILMEQRRTNALLQALTGQEVTIADVA